MCYRFVSQLGFIQKFEMGPGNIVDKLSEYENFDYSCISIDFNGPCMKVPWVDYKGTKYRIGACVVLGSDNFELPFFGQIKKMYCREDFKICLECFTFTTNGFDKHMHAYDVQIKIKIFYINIDDLFDPFPAILVRMNNGQFFISTRHAL